MSGDDALTQYFNTKEGKKLSESIMRSLLTTAVEEGRLKVEDKSEEEIAQGLIKLLRDFQKNSEREIFWIHDHRTSILKQGRLFFKTGDYQIASLLYGTWFEHWLNWLIITIGKRRGLREDEVSQIIRDIPFRAKLTWIFPLLGLRHLPITHRNAIFKITDLRNSFVHYKWKGKDETADEREEQELIDSLSNIEKTIKYLHQYENKYVYHRKKKVLQKIIKI